jgi:signal transduction histidine kinase
MLVDPMPIVQQEVLAQQLRKEQEVISLFAYACSHGISSPLKSLAGIIMLMKHGDLQQSDLSCLTDLMNVSVQRLVRTRSEFEQLAMTFRSEVRRDFTDLHHVIDSSLDLVRPQLEQSGIIVDISIRQKEDFYSDTERLRGIIDRLLANAIMFADNSKEQMNIRFLVIASHAGCNIQIVDNGVGMSHDQTSQCCEPFYRGSSQSQGIGLGLYVTQRLAQSLGGFISVSSEEKLGCAVSVWIPNIGPIQSLHHHKQGT